MRLRTLAIVSAACLGLPGLARALTFPAYTLLAGEVGQNVVSNQCYIVRGSSDFLRNGAADRAFITIANMVASGHELNGRMILVFTSTTGGTAHFSFATTYPSNIQVAPFTSYSQTYDAATKSLRARFTLNFPGCSLLVSAVYQSP